MSALERLDRPVTPLRADVWAASAAHSQVRFSLMIEAEPDSLCRVLNLFALQFLTPHQLHMTQQDDLLALELAIGGLSWHRAELIAQKMRNLICVCDVRLDAEKPGNPYGHRQPDAATSLCSPEPDCKDAPCPIPAPSAAWPSTSCCSN